MASKLSRTSVNQLEIELKEAGMKLLHMPSTSSEIVNILVVRVFLHIVSLFLTFYDMCNHVLHIFLLNC